MRCLGLYSLADVLFPNLKFIAESLALTCENETQILSLPFECFLRLLNPFGMSLHTLFCYYNFCQKLGGAPRGWGRKPQGAKVADHAWIFSLANLWHKTRWTSVYLSSILSTSRTELEISRVTVIKIIPVVPDNLCSHFPSLH